MTPDETNKKLQEATSKIESIIETTPEIKYAHIFLENKIISLRQYIAKNMIHTENFIELTHNALSKADIETHLKLREYTFQTHEHLTETYFQTLATLYELKENKPIHGKKFNEFHKNIFKLIQTKELQTLDTYNNVKNNLLTTLHTYIKQIQNPTNKATPPQLDTTINTLDDIGVEYLNAQVNKTPHNLKCDAYKLTRKENEQQKITNNDDLGRKISKLFIKRKQYQN